VSNPRLRRTREAEQDLLDIWNYIAPHSRTAADNLLRLLDAKSALLADNPFLGMARPDIGKAIRHFPVEDYLILYRARDDGAEIVCATFMAGAGCGV
jgi:toxin ParE1/3/4